MDMQHVDIIKCNMDPAWACNMYMDMQHGHGHAAWTAFVKITSGRSRTVERAWVKVTPNMRRSCRVWVKVSPGRRRTATRSGSKSSQVRGQPYNVPCGPSLLFNETAKPNIINNLTCLSATLYIFL
jgi:hypothetical protein